MNTLKTVYDVRQLLKKYGSIVYTRDRSLDLTLMEEELRELHEWKMIEKDVYLQGLLILQNEKKQV
ncbi:YqgQ family protein [Alkalihalobacillus sp. MEB130]|uniref:YqgQ family protein n=1 Tax=Alkalihalobacillus sp. MEB130 TaxID=2976704 RepID=UPI0028E1E3C6|nr:YqgQ family protein [Alkalihalobacillus sp. MEB130]